MSIIKGEEIIKVQGKSKFDELSLSEVGLMIDADSSISKDGNEFFASCAFDEFLHGATIDREDLLEIREHILNNIYLDQDGSSEKQINVEFLKTFSRDLQAKDL